jgi:hypothetical protein
VGDGALLTSGGRARFVLTQKESEILIHIQSVLGFGVVRHFDGFSRFIVEDKGNILLLMLLFNGNLVLRHRVSQLGVWFDLYSISFAGHPPVTLISLLAVPTLTDAWISGFTDAEGCFNVAILKRSNTVTGFRVILRFLLDQKNAQPTLLWIRNLFGFGNVALRNETTGVYRYSVDSFKGLVSVRDYFIAFPLKSKKAESFTQWNKVYTMVLNGDHLSTPGLEEIRVLAKSINSK